MRDSISFKDVCKYLFFLLGVASIATGIYATITAIDVRRYAQYKNVDLAVLWNAPYTNWNGGTLLVDKTGKRVGMEHSQPMTWCSSGDCGTLNMVTK